MATLPPSSDFTGSSVTEGQFKTAMTSLRTFLGDLLGSDGTKATALSTIGALASSNVAKTAGFTVVDADRGKVFECSGTFTVALTAAATLGSGFSFIVKNTGSGTITIDPNSTETIDGSSTITVSGGSSAIVTCNGISFFSLGGGSSLPTGSIITFAGSTAPAGFLVCPVSLTNISRTTYAALFAAIGTQWGAGDGSTTFGLPYFPADFAEVQANGNVGTLAAGSVISHSHTVSTRSGSTIGGSAWLSEIIGNSLGSNYATTAAGGSYNYPAGMRVLRCIKYL